MCHKGFGLLAGIMLCALPGISQKIMTMRPKQPIVCYANPNNQHTSIPESNESFSLIYRGAKMQTAVFDVEYTGFTPQAQAAFQAAVDIWSTLLTSSQTIHVKAVWTPLATGVLGSAIYGAVYANFPGAQNVNTYYPVALAEKMAGTDLNAPDEPDIYATFSSEMNWDYGLAGNPAKDKYDLVTVVLHELGHGLGFVDSYTVAGSTGEVGVQDSTIPIIYDLALESNTGLNLYHDITSPSASLKTQLTSNAIDYNSPQVLANNAGNRAQLYAPFSFSEGSSISHVDEGTYPAGNINSLMSPQIGAAESIHDPGPIVKGVFSDMGWVFTFIKHTKLPNTENIAGPFTITAVITSEAGPISQPCLYYGTGSASDTKIAMTPTSTPNEYSAVIPSTGSAATYRYYISADDKFSRRYTNPGRLISPGKPATQYYNVFTTGPDNQAPKITHAAKKGILNTQTSLTLNATITDNIGIQTATIEYRINGINQAPISLIAGTPDSIYSATLNFGAGLAIGDKLEYRIVAVDNSSHHNVGVSPSSDYYVVSVSGLKSAQTVYTNTFNNSSDDFYGDGFSIVTPEGFKNGAIHSQHPYQSGAGFPGDELTLSYQLLVPIIVKKTNAIIQFNEVVLVEPGEVGSKFGNPNFYDYVVVEGSTDGGTNWTPVEDGYDARDNTAWLTRFNSDFSHGNSAAVGDSTLYRLRTLNLLKNFHAGDEVIIRFRLFSDQLTTGWGWAIDNLSIQNDVPVVLNNFVDYILPGTTSLPITTKVSDSDGVQSLSLEYHINSQSTQTHAFTIVPTTSEYTYDLNTSGLVAGDTICYRIVATDSVSVIGMFPPNGNFFSTYILKTSLPVKQYVNDFNTSSSDFVGNFFTINKGNGFANASINSDHFYFNGLGLDFTSNYTFTLTKPITVNGENPYIQYDEIVLVEGHANGIPFGSVAFNDYVIVEGSNDGGVTWRALTEGYDGQEQQSWIDAFAVGSNATPALYKTKRIDLMSKSGFKEGDNVLVRFRLFANDKINGWGWSVDNLSVQGAITQVDGGSKNQMLQLYPNPARDRITVHLNTQTSTYAKISVFDIRGRILMSSDLQLQNSAVDKELEIHDLAPGLYIMRMEMGAETCSRTFVKY